MIIAYSRFFGSKQTPTLILVHKTKFYLKQKSVGGGALILKF